MLFKSCAVVCLLNLLLGAQIIKTQDDFKSASQASSLVQFPRNAIERLANLTNESNLWILLPSNLSESQLSEGDFSLFKLDTDQIMSHQDRDSANGPENWAESDLAALDSEETRPETVTRQGRKMSLFKNVLNKPKVSPLYLVNGTVCRFVNSQPICTTLSTTGLFRGPNQLTPQMQNNGILNGFAQQPLPNTNLQPNQRQVSPGQQSNFNNQQNNLQPFRPAAVLDDESQELNVDASNSSSRPSSLVKSQQLTSRPQAQANTMQASRPLNYVVGRRPLNFLSFGRPFRSQYQRRGKQES